MPFHYKVPSISEEDETILASAFFGIMSNQSSIKMINWTTKQLSNISCRYCQWPTSNGLPRVHLKVWPLHRPLSTPPPPKPSAIANASTSARHRKIHPCHPSSKNVVDAGRVRFKLPLQRVEKNSDEWCRECLEQSGERKAKQKNNHCGSPIRRLSQMSAGRPARDMPLRKLFRDELMRSRKITLCPQETPQ